jgi:hypothetical protein
MKNGTYNCVVLFFQCGIGTSQMQFGVIHPAAGVNTYKCPLPLHSCPKKVLHLKQNYLETVHNWLGLMHIATASQLIGKSLSPDSNNNREITSCQQVVE